MRVRTRSILLGAGLVVAIAVVVLGRQWWENTKNGGQLYAEPFRIAGNFYYVGANDVASFLITGSQGHVLIDGGYPGTAKMIRGSVEKLGFKISDVRILLNSEAHFDHGGGLAELQQASGAQLWASEGSADVLAAGGYDPHLRLPMRLISFAVRYPRPRIDHRFSDGATVRLGEIALTAHVTPGHTRGCTTWTFDVTDAGRLLHVVDACSLVTLGGSYPGYQADLERTFTVLRSLPADVWVTSHARLFGRYRKFTEQQTAAAGANPFVDPAGYRAYIEEGEQRLRRETGK